MKTDLEFQALAKTSVSSRVFSLIECIPLDTVFKDYERNRFLNLLYEQELDPANAGKWDKIVEFAMGYIHGEPAKKKKEPRTSEQQAKIIEAAIAFNLERHEILLAYLEKNPRLDAKGKASERESLLGPFLLALLSAQAWASKFGIGPFPAFQDAGPRLLATFINGFRLTHEMDVFGMKEKNAYGLVPKIRGELANLWSAYFNCSWGIHPRESQRKRTRELFELLDIYQYRSNWSAIHSQVLHAAFGAIPQYEAVAILLDRANSKKDE